VKKQNIVLVGFRGCGKTRFGQAIAKETGLPFADLDLEVEFIIGEKIASFVKKYGWQVFREVEQRVTHDFCRNFSGILATGGGTIENSKNFQNLKKTGTFVFINPNFSDVKKYLLSQEGKDTTPRMNPDIPFAQELDQMWEQRKGIYSASSEIEITPDWDKLSQQKEVRLEVDEHSFGGRDMVITIVEAVSHQVLAILKRDTMEALKVYLKTIPKKVKEKVSVASTDLNASYWRVLKEWKKDIKLCADPFHVVGLANRLVNEERRFLQGQDKKRKLPVGPLRCGGERLRDEARQKRNIMLKRYPTLMISYQLKEEIRAMYLTKDATEARLLFEDILSTIDEALSQRELLGIRQELATFSETLHRWRERILNFFEYGL